MSWMVTSFTTRQKPPIDFDIDGEKFRAIGVAPVGLLLDVSTSDGPGTIPAMLAFVDKVLEADSAERFRARLRDPEHPIDGETFNGVVAMLTRAYGQRTRNGDSDG